MSYKTQTQTASKKFYYSTPDNAVTYDHELCKTTINLYSIMEDMMDKKTHTLVISVAALAIALTRSHITTQRHLAILRKLGIIEVIYRKDPNNPRKNLVNLYVIRGRHAERYEGTEYAHPEVEPKTTPPWYQKRHPVLEPFFEQDIDSKNTLKRDTPKKGTPNGGAIAPVEIGIWEEDTSSPKSAGSTDETQEKQNPKPSQSRCNLGENLNPQEPVIEAEVVENPTPTPENAKEGSYPDDIMQVDLTGVPEIMVPTARYWCFRTGRRVLTAKEVEALQWCNGKHVPTYVNKSIDKAIAIWTKQGKLVCQQHFTYIKTMLEHQQTFDPAKKGRKSNKKAIQSEVQTQPVEKPVVELAMPLEAAEKVIVEYRPANRPAKALPAALSELFEGIKAKDAELTEARMAALPKDEDGLEILPEDEGELEALYRGVDLPDYLRLKFPNATDAGLNTDRLSASEKTALATAMEIDKACAYCDNPEECRLPAGSQPGRARPVAVLSNGRVSAGRSLCLTCKHSCAASKLDPDFERRVQECGLTDVQAKRDFASYKHESPEVVVAKARAILAAKNGTNLVLAGNAGAGKTHLATAIALEAIRMGRKAIVANVPEMLEGICHTAQNHEDTFGLLMKYKSVDCLVLDDWGKERRSDARMDYMYQIINYRYERGLQTIATTNEITPDGLKDRFYGDRIEPMVSRILSNGEWVTIQDAEDYRLKPKPLVEPTAESDEEAPESEVVNSTGASTPEAESVADSGEIEPKAEQSVNDTAPVAETSTQSDEEGVTSEVAEAKPVKYTTMYVPHYDDGLDDDDDKEDADLRLYGGLYSD